jgi:hypothetical protein
MYQEGVGTRRCIRATGSRKMTTGMKENTFENRKLLEEELKRIGAIRSAKGR